MIQVEYIQPHISSFGTTRHVGYRSILDDHLAKSLIAKGIAKEYTSSDLMADSRTQYENISMRDEIKNISQGQSVKASTTWFSKLINFFT